MGIPQDEVDNIKNMLDELYAIYKKYNFIPGETILSDEDYVKLCDEAVPLCDRYGYEFKIQSNSINDNYIEVFGFIEGDK